ncbi:MAG: ATP-grasp domain-containing protein [Candidatus Omnitrophica bacterium]|nr:ATP-grasp domain-containing protein [Candidatus Omnitrophota bacterium]
MKKRDTKILIVCDSPYFTPRGYDFSQEFEHVDWYAESQAYETLRELGYQVSIVGLYDNISVLLDEVRENRPDVIFNLCEVFHQRSDLDKNVAAFFEILNIPYTGASPASLFICNDKALSKKILRFHRIRVPRFSAFYREHRVWLPKRLRLPLIVKPLTEEGSRGIALASVVDSEEAFLERVRFIHESLKNDAIAEEYIDGREFYVSVLGGKRLKVLPFRECKFGQLPEDEPRIATYKAKWDGEYRKRWGIKNEFAGRISEEVEDRIKDICKRAFRALRMESYARFDIRVTGAGRVYIIEANANPSLEMGDEVVISAEKAGITYERLLEKLIAFAFERNA